MMKTIRNLTLVVLLATVHLTGGEKLGFGGTVAVASATARASSALTVAQSEVNCSFEEIDHHGGPGYCYEEWMYQGECEECGLDEYNHAIDYCYQEHNFATMSEYFCVAEWPMYEFMCHDPSLCWD